MAQTLAVFKPHRFERAGSTKFACWGVAVNRVSDDLEKSRWFHLSPNATCVPVQGFTLRAERVSLLSHKHQESGRRNATPEDKESK